MGKIPGAPGDRVQNIVAFIVMIFLAVLGFYLTIFVPATGANLDGFGLSGDFDILPVSILVISAIVAGVFPLTDSSDNRAL